MKQLLVTPAAGKRLIAKALAADAHIKGVLKKGTLVMIAGTTNSYLAQEVMSSLGAQDFSSSHFFRGVTLPPSQKVTAQGRLADESKFPGDVVIVDGIWQKGKTIADVVDELKAGDVIVKGANAVDLEHRQAAVLVGSPTAGSTPLVLQAAIGRRVRLIVPVGLEKRVVCDLHTLALKLNSPSASGYRLLPFPGEVFTEIDAFNQLTGGEAVLVAAGGVCGAEGSCLLAVTGTPKQEKAAEALWRSVANEPPFTCKQPVNVHVVRRVAT
jgi:hypothetical protein